MRSERVCGAGGIRTLLTGAAMLAALMCLTSLALVCGAVAAGEESVDAVTEASVDAATGASKQVEEIKVTDTFSAAYAVNDDGALFIMAKDLSNAYSRDELASDSLFKGKTMVVKGTVEKTSKTDAAKPWVTLAGDGDGGKKIRCSLETLPQAAAPDKVVQIRGVCDGMKLNISITEGVIVD